MKKITRFFIVSILTLTVAALSCCGAKKTGTVTEKNLPVRLNLG